MANLRCRPGVLAKIVCSKNPLLIERLVIVESWNDDGRWNVCLLGEPSFGFTMYSGLPVITNAFAAKDSSLKPLRGDEPEVAERLAEVAHG